MAEDNGGELKPHFITPQPILLETNVDKLLARSLPPPLPSPSLKPRKTSVSARASPIVAQVSAPSARKLSKAQQRKELMEGTGHASPPPPAQQQHGTEHKSLHDEADDDDDDFSRVRARSRRQGSQFDDVQPRRRATGGLPEPPNGSACGRGSPSSAASSPPTAGKNADSKMAVGGAQQQQQQRQRQGRCGSKWQPAKQSPSFSFEKEVVASRKRRQIDCFWLCRQPERQREERHKWTCGHS
eukprot:INCI6197.10.p2 GENE.INCI6197.10~~INCI6197.10.p2  ORF type:complete len:242 (+),score=50.83 INCI6197.10:275-1000(+)